MKFYCEKHGKDVFESRLPGRVECYAESETEKHDLGRFPDDEFWEYCCNCQAAWRACAQATYEPLWHCPRCNLTVTARYLCERCGVFTLQLEDANDNRPSATHNKSPVRTKGWVRSKC